ncbi:hypothetical protein [Thermovenabulum sp.]|uniref:hypothetical protein n=1 Tax=Thermovenabulum sp. TaxID=3100335 RepID=UPI003C7A41B4
MRKKYFSVLLIILLILFSFIFIIYQKSDYLFIKILSMFDKGSERENIKDLVKEQETNQEETNDIKKQEEEEIQNTEPKEKTGKDSQNNTKELIEQKIQNEPIITDNITKIENQDKAEIMKIVLGKLSRDDISFLLNLAKDGLTEEEKERAKALAYQRFTKEEIEEIKRLYEKYRNLVK